MSHLPIWLRGFETTARRHRALTSDADCEVAVVGAGISGMSIAYLLQRDGYDVLVLDDGPVGGGETERTSAHLSSAADDGYAEIERVHGAAAARVVAAAHTEAIATIEAMVEDLGVECGFARVDGYLFAAPDTTPDELDRELAAIKRAGIAADVVTRVPDLSFDTGRAIHYPRQGRIHPLQYLRALTNAFVELGGRIYTNTHVQKIEGGETPRLQTSDGHNVTAHHVVVATHSPVNDRFAIHTKQAGYRTYVVGFALPPGTMPDIVLWDTGDPYHYVRTAGDVLLIGGEDQRVGQHAKDANERYAALVEWARVRFRVGDVVTRWSGQVMEPVDGLPFIGKDPEGEDNVYVVSGHSGQGMTTATIAGIVLRDLLSGEAHPWASTFDPSRKPFAALKDYAVDALAAASGYKEWITGADKVDADALPRNSGAVIRHGLWPVAVSVDAQGKRHTCSAACPHLGGVVQWNNDEKEFECPVHASRFDACGKVVHGPANSDLAPADDEAEVTEPLPIIDAPVR